MHIVPVRPQLAALLLSTVPIAVHAQSAEVLAQWGVTPEQARLHPAETAAYLEGRNPHPVSYNLPPQMSLSRLARMGKQLFYDPNLSISGQHSCATCHIPSDAYGPPETMDTVMLGGPDLDQPGFRPPPSLRYLYRQKSFGIGPEIPDENNVLHANRQPPAADTTIAVKSAATTDVSATNLVPQGGLFWDGRADSLQSQADGPLMNPVEMAAPSHFWLAGKMRHAAYRETFQQLFGAGIFESPELLVIQMQNAIARYELEDQAAFYPFTSKYDDWLQGKARFTAQEMRGYFAFNDPARGNCAACHLSRPTEDGRPPLFTDQQYEALGVPRNPKIAANQDPDWYDLGICGPFRVDLHDQTRYCGMFLTPTLRNVAVRRVFFHNSRYTTLQQVLAFFNDRDTHPERVYPRDAQGQVMKFDDLPEEYRKNVDVADPPFDHQPGDESPMSEQDMSDIIAFLKTLTDADVALSIQH